MEFTLDNTMPSTSTSLILVVKKINFLEKKMILEYSECELYSRIRKNLNFRGTHGDPILIQTSNLPIVLIKKMRKNSKAIYLNNISIMLRGSLTHTAVGIRNLNKFVKNPLDSYSKLFGKNGVHENHRCCFECK